MLQSLLVDLKPKFFWKIRAQNKLNQTERKTARCSNWTFDILVVGNWSYHHYDCMNKFSLPRSKPRDIIFTNNTILVMSEELFCSTGLPLASSKWVWLTLSSLCPLFYAVSSINHSNIRKKILGSTKNQTRGCWVWSKYATSVLSSPPGTKNLLGNGVCMSEFEGPFQKDEDSDRGGLEPERVAKFSCTTAPTIASPRQGTWLTRLDTRPQVESTLDWVADEQVEL